ncbi:MAG: glutaredoxin domain-containing protein [Verrucomicrobiales bacterium]|nr:glutaredoxin domain-containing protein [Verrucomicrobiales bacterium]
MEEDEVFKVYVKPGCPWCVDAIAYLKKGGYHFEEIDVTSDPVAFAKMQEISGQTSAPTMTVGNLLLADFGVEELVPFLEEHGLLR